MLSPDAAANSPARSGRPASAATSRRSWYVRGSTDASVPSRHGSTVTAPMGDTGREARSSALARSCCNSSIRARSRPASARAASS